MELQRNGTLALAPGAPVGLGGGLIGLGGAEFRLPILVSIFRYPAWHAVPLNLLISLPTILIGLTRYSARGALSNRQDLVWTVDPMGVGSVIGALAGGALMLYVPKAALKFLLGMILVGSAMKMFKH